MFKEQVDKFCENEEEFFYKVMLTQAFNIHSPFEIAKDVDFPNKNEMGGVVLKFIGGGAAYFNIQVEMPSNKEVKSYFDIGKYLQSSFGEYVEVLILCSPDIEIRDIEVVFDDTCAPDFLSLRKSDAIVVLDRLIDKLENKKEFTIEDHVLRIIFPFMKIKDSSEFELKYSKFLKLFEKNNIVLPSAKDLDDMRMIFCRWFSDDFKVCF